MTKKDYLLIAGAFKDAEPKNDSKYISDASIQAEAVHNQWVDNCNTMAIYLEEENPKFNRERFLKACGIKD